MNFDEENVCRLCFRNVECQYEEISDTIRDTLHALMINVNLDVSRDAVICGECAATALRCLRFKLDCVSKEQHLLLSIIDKALAKIKLKNMFESTEMPNEDFTGICTFCLDPANSSLSNIDGFKQSVVARTLPKLFPEKKLCLIKNKACSTCGVELEAYLNFLFKCMKTEENIKAYLRLTIATGPVNLGDIYHASKIRRYQCSFCQFETKWKVSLSNHIAIQHPPNTRQVKKYKCPHCTFETKWKRYLNTHIKMQHSALEATMYKCTNCTYETKWKERLNTHMGIQHDAFKVKNYKCSHCAFETKWKSSLNTHIKMQHSALEATIYKCPNCTYETKWRTHLYAHKKMQHSAFKVNKYKCPNCTFETKWKSYFNTHLKTEHNALGATMYKCSSCTYETKQKGNLKVHIENQHNERNVKKYKCSNCTYETNWKRSLNRHITRCEK